MKTLFAALALCASATIGAATPACGTAYSAACCKVCHKGKACGDSCIGADQVCHKGKGCACDG